MRYCGGGGGRGGVLMGKVGCVTGWEWHWMNLAG